MPLNEPGSDATPQRPESPRRSSPKLPTSPCHAGPHLGLVGDYRRSDRIDPESAAASVLEERPLRDPEYFIRP